MSECKHDGDAEFVYLDRDADARVICNVIRCCQCGTTRPATVEEIIEAGNE